MRLAEPVIASGAQGDGCLYRGVVVGPALPSRLPRTGARYATSSMEFGAPQPYLPLTVLGRAVPTWPQPKSPTTPMGSWHPGPRQPVG